MFVGGVLVAMTRLLFLTLNPTHHDRTGTSRDTCLLLQKK